MIDKIFNITIFAEKANYLNSIFLPKIIFSCHNQRFMYLIPLHRIQNVKFGSFNIK